MCRIFLPLFRISTNSISLFPKPTEICYDYAKRINMEQTLLLCGGSGIPGRPADLLVQDHQK